jgi:hypothetical protein
MIGRVTWPVVALVIAAAGVGCGGDDSTNGSGMGSATTETGTTETGTPDTATQTAPDESASTLKPRKRKSSRSAEFGDRRDRVFRKAKSECSSQDAARLARRYDARSRKPADVAEAYAKKSYGPATRGAAYEGCVAGLGERAPQP